MSTTEATVRRTTAGRSEIHSDRAYLGSPKPKNPVGNNPEPRPPSTPSVRICGFLVVIHGVAMPRAQRN
jgi:hypothetical protein